MFEEEKGGLKVLSITDLWEEHGRLKKQVIRIEELVASITLNLITHLEKHHKQTKDEDPRKYLENILVHLSNLQKEMGEA